VAADSPRTGGPLGAATTCLACGGAARTASDTLDCYFDVVWCFLACSTRLDENFGFRAEDFEAWLPVRRFHNGLDTLLYVHLYRFLGRVLHEMGLLQDPEPITSYHGNGTVLSEGKKMSKHNGTAVTADALLDRYGADPLRLGVLAAAGPLKNVEWSESCVRAAHDLVVRIWNLIDPRAPAIRRALGDVPRSENGRKVPRHVMRSARRMTDLLDRYQLSGCAEELRLSTAWLAQFARDKELDAGTTAWASRDSGLLFAEGVRVLVLLLGPFCPYLAEELWERIGGTGLVATAAWPVRA
jgi:leucyl-tRNA synthetase